MPYIRPERRGQFEQINACGDGAQANNPGELNYLITDMIREYIVQHKPCYKTFNDVIGVLECAKMEVYRRVVATYEDEKKKENGDVY